MKLNITEIDKNFLEGTGLKREGIVWYDILNDPFEIRGLAVHTGERFERLPVEFAATVSDGVKLLATHTAGGRVRFKTDSSYIGIRCESLYEGSMTHMPVSGSAGLDIYANGCFKGGVRPQNDDGGIFEGCVNLNGTLNDIEINLPLYNGIKRMYIGLDTGCTLAAPRPYTIDKPIVYYGSSITQGGCASRPGNSYQGFISRWLDSDYINLGFSGNGRGEESMARYIAGLQMSAFVMDYDHNAYNPEWLQKTHEPFFKLIRAAHPDMPVVLVTKPDPERDPVDAEKRRDVILKTYQNAVNAGDRHVGFLDGWELFGEKDRDACTVDGSHPNDLGFYRMAQAIYNELIKLMKD